ncbi:peptidoglycan recognition family protein [Ammoniphilus sp. 3BR4]|uniref:peptidoglycan recognition protein family protein n=1 Tax=Ammoniphilus sp. 3BR4 TaxID=3158265 RepID=UPI003467CEC5
MSWQYGLLFSNADVFLVWFKNVSLTAQFNAIHVHHTHSPNHSHFKGNNHRELQDGMRDYHVKTKGWDDIAQHITIFPDGKIMTGRNPDQMPASAIGYNGSEDIHPFMFEMIGNFDKGNDVLLGQQLETAIKICKHWRSKGSEVVFHRECLINGKEPKSCPGTGIDKQWFMDLVEKESAYMMKPEDANKIIRFPGVAWELVVDKASKDEFNRLANELRKVSGQEVK